MKPDPPERDTAADLDSATEEPPYPQEPAEQRGARARARRQAPVARSEQDKWRGMGGLDLARHRVSWALSLLNRSGDNTAKLLAMFQESQKLRETSAKQIAGSSDARRSTVKAAQALLSVSLARAAWRCARNRRTARRPPEGTRNERSTRRSTCSERSTATQP